MKATELLKKQHKEVRDLFKRVESEERGDAKTELFEELATKLVARLGGARMFESVSTSGAGFGSASRSRRHESCYEV